MAVMSDSMFAKARHGVGRAIREAGDQVIYAFHTNRAGTTIPTQSVSRPVRVTLPGEQREWTVVVTVTEKTSGVASDNTVAATDDI